jgi:hypothetical protein
MKLSNLASKLFQRRNRLRERSEGTERRRSRFLAASLFGMTERDFNFRGASRAKRGGV